MQVLIKSLAWFRSAILILPRSAAASSQPTVARPHHTRRFACSGAGVGASLAAALRRMRRARLRLLRPRSYLPFASITLALVLGGCAVLTVDVDVYKGPLINEESVQLDQLTVLAMGAKPLLVSLRDKAECQFGADWQLQRLRSNEWYRVGYCAPDPKKHSPFTNDLAIRVNAILSLYESRTPRDRELWISGLKGNLADLESHVNIVFPSEELVARTAKTIGRYKMSDGLSTAFAAFLIPTNSWRQDDTLFKALADIKGMETNWSDLLLEPAGKGGSGARFGILERAEFLDTCARLAFPEPSQQTAGTAKKNAEERHWLTNELSRIAVSFRESRTNLEAIFRLSIALLRTVNVEEEGIARESALAHAALLVGSVVRPKSLLAVLQAKAPLPEDIVQLQEIFNKRLPADAIRNAKLDPLPPAVAPGEKDYAWLSHALVDALQSEPEKLSWLLMSAHRWLIDLDPTTYDTSFQGSDWAKNHRAKINRAYGLAAGPFPRVTRDQLLSSISEGVLLLTTGGEDLAKGRLDEGVETLIEEYLKASSDGEPSRQVQPQVRFRRGQLLTSLVGFAEKIKYIGDNEILLKEPRGPLNPMPAIGTWFKPDVAAKSESYVTLLQSLGNSIISLVNELRYREHNPHPAADAGEAERTGQEVAAAILTNAQSRTPWAAGNLVHTNVTVALETTNLNISVNVTNTISPLPKGLDVAAQLLGALNHATNSIQSMDNLLATLRNLRIAYTAAGLTKEVKTIEAAIIVAEDYRRNLLPLRPPISVLRNASAVTSLQTGTATSWRNMLQAQAWRSVPLLPSIFAGGNHRSEIQRELDRQYWQNINQIRLAAAVKANYVVVKDDIGNWYVKGFSADPSSAIKAGAALLSPKQTALQAANAITNTVAAKTPGTVLQDQETPFRNAYDQETDTQWNTLETWITTKLQGDISNKWSKTLPTIKSESFFAAANVENTGGITNSGAVTNGATAVGVTNIISYASANDGVTFTNTLSFTCVGSSNDVRSLTNRGVIASGGNTTVSTNYIGRITNAGSISTFASKTELISQNNTLIISNSLNITNVGTIALAEAVASLTNAFNDYLQPAPKVAAASDKIIERLEKLQQFRNELARNLDNPPASNAVLTVVNAQSRSFLSNRVATVGKLENALNVLYQSTQTK